MGKEGRIDENHPTHRVDVDVDGSSDAPAGCLHRRWPAATAGCDHRAQGAGIPGGIPRGVPEGAGFRVTITGPEGSLTLSCRESGLALAVAGY